MNIRALDQNDLQRLKLIHDEYFSHEFSFPDFFKGYLCSFTVEEEGEIVVAGGVRTIAESVLITNKSVPIAKKRRALLQVLDASRFICKRFDYDQIHAFVQDENWLRHLKKIGFNDTRGQSLVLNI